MKNVSQYLSGYRLVITTIVLLVYAGSSMCNTKNANTDNGIAYGANNNYVGSQACIACHKEIYNSYIKAPHYRTSSTMDAARFEDVYAGTDSVFYNDNLFVSVHKIRDSIFQSAHSGGMVAATHSMDMVIGSGRKGQTFLFWNDSSLYQLPLSYSFANNKWVNSPGYPADKAVFNRTIPVKCFECHSSYAEQRLNGASPPTFNKNTLVLGISCETCHGPAKKHVEYYADHPGDKKEAFIITKADLNRGQQLDACASCHSGIRENIEPAFSFVPGDKLDIFFKPAYNKDSVAALDVHGNQYGLLTASKCFKQSVKLNCSSCHNVHRQESDSKEIFSQRCMSCHNEQSGNFCKEKNVDKHVLASNCIDCHMPLQASGQITFTTGDNRKFLYDSVRTHLIRTYRKSEVVQ